MASRDSTIPIGRFYTVILIMLVMSILFGWLTYEFGEEAGQKDSTIIHLEAVTKQQKNDNKVIYEEIDNYINKSASDYLLYDN